MSTVSEMSLSRARNLSAATPWDELSLIADSDSAAAHAGHADVLMKMEVQADMLDVGAAAVRFS